MGLQMNWAVDFLDAPFQGSDFKFWGGEGDLTIDSVTYRGANGVITINPPREKASESVKMSIEMDASDPAVRAQLRHDVGPLRVRVRWLYFRPPTPGGNDGITPFVNRAFYWSSDDLMLYPTADNDIETGTNDVVEPVRFLSVGEESNVQVGVTYYVRHITSIYFIQGWSVMSFYDTAANAANAQGLTSFVRGQPGRIGLTSDGAGVVVGRFDASQVVEADPGGWTLTGKQFVGRLSAPMLRGAKYQIDIESQISDIQRGRVLNWSNDTQQARHPGDKGMEYLTEYADGISTKWPP